MQVQDWQIIRDYLYGSSTLAIDRRYSIPYQKVRSILLKYGVKLRSNKINSRKYTVDHSFFNCIDTEEKAYWLGFFGADGYVTRKDNSKQIGISLCAIDKRHIEKLSNSMKSNYPINTYHPCGGYENSKDYARLLISSDELFDGLTKNGVIERKSKIYKFNNALDDALIPHYIRGYFDGDGSLVISNGCPQGHILGTKEFLDGLCDYLGTKGIVLNRKYYARKESCKTLDLRLSGIRFYKFLTLIYGDASVYLDRKYEKYKQANEYYGRLYQ